MNVQAIAVLALLHGRLPSGFTELRFIKDGGGSAAPPQFFDVKDFELIAAQATELGKTSNAYFSVAPRTRHAGTKDAVGPVPAVWADIDSKEALSALRSFDLEPSVLVSSGSPGGHHAYWVLDSPTDVGTAEELNRKLAEKLGSDPAVKDASRVLRLPGTLNHKHQPPVEVELVDSTSTHYSVEQLNAATEPDGDGAPAPVQAGTSGGKPSPWVSNVLSKLLLPVPAGNGWLSYCPGHDDGRPSLSVGQGDDGRCLLNCFAGCTFEDVLYGLGMQASDLGPSPSPDGGGKTGRKSDQLRVTQMVEEEGAEFFHDERQTPFARLRVDGHFECHEIGSKSFARWLRGTYWKRHSENLFTDSIREATELFAAQAEFDGDMHPVHRRVGGDLDELYIDLGDKAWRTAVVRSDGTWDVTDDSPARFARENGALPLPLPQRGGSLDDLRSVVHVPDDDTWTVVRGALLAMFHPSGPYFVTLITGVPGSGKTSLARTLAGLVDPFKAQFLSGSPKANDLIVTASKSWLVGLDNQSLVRREMSDLLCVVATGGGDRRRTLYTQDDVHALEVKRPSIVTSIGRIATRPDLIDRGAPVHLAERIPREERRRETELLAMYRDLQPRLFGGVLDALAGALKHLPDVDLPHLPRMADATAFVTAAEQVLPGEVGAFYTALTAAQKEALSEAVEGSPFIEAVVQLMQEFPKWKGSATDLMRAVEKFRPAATNRRWPSTASVASKELDEHQIALDEHGIKVDRIREAGGSRSRVLCLTFVARDAGRPRTQASPGHRWGDPS